LQERRKKNQRGDTDTYLVAWDSPLKEGEEMRSDLILLAVTGDAGDR